MGEEIVHRVAVDGVEARRRPRLTCRVFGVDVVEKIFHCELKQREKGGVQLHSERLAGVGVEDGATVTVETDGHRDRSTFRLEKAVQCLGFWLR